MVRCFKQDFRLDHKTDGPGHLITRARRNSNVSNIA